MKVVNKKLCKYCRNPCNISWENLPAYSRVHKNLFLFFMISKKDVILPQVGVCSSCGGENGQKYLYVGIREARLATLEEVYADNYVRELNKKR